MLEIDQVFETICGCHNVRACETFRTTCHGRHRSLHTYGSARGRFADVYELLNGVISGENSDCCYSHLDK